MRLNDKANDVERQHLLLYAMRLACADTEEIERERRVYIERRTCAALSFATGVAILEGALAIGRQADLLNLAEVEVRMSEQTEVPDRSRTHNSIVTTVKS